MDGGQVVLDTTAMVYGRTFAYFDDVCKKKREARIVEARHKIESLPKGIESKGLQGDKRVERLRYLLENGFVDDQSKRIVRSREQRQLHEVTTRSVFVFLKVLTYTSRFISGHVYQNSIKTNGRTVRNGFSTCSASRNSSKNLLS